MTSYLPLQPLRMTYTTGLRAVPRGAWTPYTQQRVYLGETRAWGGERRGPSPTTQVRVRDRTLLDPCSTPAIGSPDGEENAVPYCKRDTEIPGQADGASMAHGGRYNLPDPSGRVGGGHQEEEEAGEARRGVPALALRGRRLKRLKDVWGRAVKRLVLTPMGLTAGPLITRRRELSLPRLPRPLSRLPPGCLPPRSVHKRKGIRSPRCSPRCHRAGRANRDPGPGPGGAGGRMLQPRSTPLPRHRRYGGKGRPGPESLRLSAIGRARAG